MPRINSTAWAAGNPVLAARLEDFNEDIDNIYATGSDHFKVYHLSAQPALQVTIGPGTYRVGGTEGQYAGGTFTVSASVTTYIMIDSAGAIQTSTSAWNSLYTRLAVVVSGGASITSITDWRNKVVGGVLGGLVFDDTQGTNTTPDDYNDSTFKAQLKTITNIGLNGIATGTYARLVGFRGQTSSTFGLSHETAYTDDGIYHRNGSTTTWGSWLKIGIKNDLSFGTSSNVSIISSSSNPANTTSILLTKGGFASASSNFYQNNNAGGCEIVIQTSPNNSTWTDIVKNTGRIDTGLSQNQFGSASVSCFIPPSTYVRAVGRYGSYFYTNITISLSVSQFL